MCGVGPDRRSGLAAEGAVVVEIEEIEPRADVLAGRGELSHGGGEIREGLSVAVRRAVLVISAPCGDFPRLAWMLRVAGNPGEQLAVAATLRDLSTQGLVGQAGK